MLGIELTGISQGYYMMFCISVVSTSDYESAGLSLIPDKGSQPTAHPAVHLP